MTTVSAVFRILHSYFRALQRVFCIFLYLFVQVRACPLVPVRAACGEPSQSASWKTPGLRSRRSFARAAAVWQEVFRGSRGNLESWGRRVADTPALQTTSSPLIQTRIEQCSFRLEKNVNKAASYIWISDDC